MTADGLEAARTRDSFTFGRIAANSSAISFDVTDTVRAWANGAGDHGRAFLDSGSDGCDFYSSESDDVKQRPRLVVEFTPPPPPAGR